MRGTQTMTSRSELAFLGKFFSLKLYCITLPREQANTGIRPLIKDAGAEKLSFLCFVFFCCTSSRQGKTFLFYQNFITSTVQGNHARQKSVRYNKHQTTNKETPQAIRIPQQDSFRILGLIVFNLCFILNGCKI